MRTLASVLRGSARPDRLCRGARRQDTLADQELHRATLQGARRQQPGGFPPPRAYACRIGLVEALRNRGIVRGEGRLCATGRQRIMPKEGPSQHRLDAVPCLLRSVPRLSRLFSSMERLATYWRHLRGSDPALGVLLERVRRWCSGRQWSEFGESKLQHSSPCASAGHFSGSASRGART